MTRERFRVLVSEAIDTIPPRFAGAMTNIAIVVEAAATAEVLDELEMDPGDELFGLYQGTPLPERGWAFGNALPDRITLYQQTIEDFCEGDEECIVMEIGDAIGRPTTKEIGQCDASAGHEIEIVSRHHQNSRIVLRHPVLFSVGSSRNIQPADHENGSKSATRLFVRYSACRNGGSRSSTSM